MFELNAWWTGSTQNLTGNKRVQALTRCNVHLATRAQNIALQDIYFMISVVQFLLTTVGLNIQWANCNKNRPENLSEVRLSLLHTHSSEAVRQAKVPFASKNTIVVMKFDQKVMRAPLFNNKNWRSSFVSLYHLRTDWSWKIVQIIPVWPGVKLSLLAALSFSFLWWTCKKRLEMESCNITCFKLHEADLHRFHYFIRH